MFFTMGPMLLLLVVRELLKHKNAALQPLASSVTDKAQHWYNTMTMLTRFIFCLRTSVKLKNYFIENKYNNGQLFELLLSVFNQGLKS